MYKKIFDLSKMIRRFDILIFRNTAPHSESYCFCFAELLFIWLLYHIEVGSITVGEVNLWVLGILFFLKEKSS